MMSRHRRLTRVLAATIALAVATGLLSGCANEFSTGEVPPPSADLPQKTDKVSVFFSTGRSLSEERRLVDGDDKYAATLKELLEAEPEQGDFAIVQPTAPVRSVKFDNGTVTIDWDAAVLDFEADKREYNLALASLILTFGQFPEVEKLAFTVEGKTSGQVGGKDIEKFWGAVTLKDQPWDIERPPNYVDPKASKETTSDEIVIEPKGSSGQ